MLKPSQMQRNTLFKSNLFQQKKQQNPFDCSRKLTLK